jgi:putative restriction endonuclease
VSGSDAASRLLALRQYRHDGARVPHKPLLVLLALSRLAETGSSELVWDGDGERLAELIAGSDPRRRPVVRRVRRIPSRG